MTTSPNRFMTGTGIHPDQSRCGESPQPAKEGDDQPSASPRAPRTLLTRWLVCPISSSAVETETNRLRRNTWASSDACLRVAVWVLPRRQSRTVRDCERLHPLCWHVPVVEGTARSRFTSRIHLAAGLVAVGLSWHRRSLLSCATPMCFPSGGARSG